MGRFTCDIGLGACTYTDVSGPIVAAADYKHPTVLVFNERIHVLGMFDAGGNDQRVFHLTCFKNGSCSEWFDVYGVLGHTCGGLNTIA